MIGSHLPPGYDGSLSAAISTYSLHPTLEIARGMTRLLTIHSAYSSRRDSAR